jgi:RNA polymerase sigma-70 factor (ECF subfamily)
MKLVSYNKSEVMLRAWKLFKNQDIRTDEMFSICLKESWAITIKKGRLNFDLIYKQYKDEVMNRLRMKVKSTEDCEDMCIDIFMKINEYLQVFNCERGQFNTWLYTFVNNKVIDYYRGEGKKAEQRINVSDFVDDENKECYTFVGGENTSNDVENRELQRKIRRAIRTLKPIEKRLAILRLIKEYDYSEIAEMLEMPMNSVKVMIFRAKQNLQIALKQEYALLR